MAEFNKFQAYCALGRINLQDSHEIEKMQTETEHNAFLTFHLVETQPQMEKFVNDLCRGRKYNQKYEWDGETLELEFMESSIRVTLDSPQEGRSGYFEYPVYTK